MADDDLFKRYLEMWASMVGVSRDRAESIVRDLVERGRAGTEELNELVRRLIREQVTALGLATKDDLARLRAEVDELKGGPATAAAPKKAAPKKAAPKKAAPKKAGAATKPAGISRSASARRAVAGAPPAAGDAVVPKG